MVDYSFFNQENYLQLKINLFLIQSYNLLQNKLISIKKDIINNTRLTKIKKKFNQKTLVSYKKGKVKKYNYKNKIVPIHTKMSFDNVLRKIKVMYHNFIIKFVNDYIKFLYDGFQRFRLRKISGKITQNVTKKHNKFLSNISLKEFLSNKISSKYKQDKDKNKKIVAKLYYLKSQIKELFDMTYINFYKNIFLCTNRIYLEEHFGINENTLTFRDNLEIMKETENEQYIKEVETIGEKKFIEFISLNDNFNNEINDIHCTIFTNNDFFNLNSKNKYSLFEVKKNNK